MSKVYLSIQSFSLQFSLSSGILQFEGFFLNLILQFSDIEFLEFIITELWSLQWLNMIHCLIFILVFELRNFDLFHIFDVYDLIMQATYLKLLVD